MDEDTKRSLIYQFSNGRTTSSKELTFDEARNFLRSMVKEQQERDERLQQMIQREKRNVLSSIYHLSFKIPFLCQGYTDDTPEDREMNKAKINAFCREKSKYRKNITQMSLEELQAIKQQFEAIARKGKNDEK